MFWIIRYGRRFYLQNSDRPGLTKWGDRATARLFSTQAQASLVAGALLKSGLCRACALSVEQQYPAFTDVPPHLLERLVRCAQRLACPPAPFASVDASSLPQEYRTAEAIASLDAALIDSSVAWRQLWRRVAVLANKEVQGLLSGKTVPTGDALEIDTDLLLDLQECSLKLALRVESSTPDVIAAVQDFARKTVALSAPYITSLNLFPGGSCAEY